MRRLIIEFGEGAEGCSGFDVIEEYGRTGLGLTWDEMLGQVVSLTHPRLSHQPQYRMQTPEAWAKERAERASRFVDGGQQPDPVYPDPVAVDYDFVEVPRP